MWSEICGMLLGIGAFPFAGWVSGARDKYPELMFPLFYLYGDNRSLVDALGILTEMEGLRETPHEGR